ncbi:MAG: hypothetical protein IT381_14830 [Deltaproteobacteria bacterium]|nr:hypothetical protein [Deltaproteobacteria bacterium]
MTVTLGAMLACASAPKRPTLLEAAPGDELAELSGLVDVDPDADVVDVRLVRELSRPALIRARAGDAVVLRVAATPPRTLSLDGAAASVFSPTSDASVWLVMPQRPGVFALRAATAQTTSVEAFVAVSPREASVKERVLFLDDRADAAERIDGLGNVLLMNGAVRPTLTVASGSVERWHVANIATARKFILVLPGHGMAHVSGTEMAEVELRPGDSVTIDVRLDGPPSTTVDLATLDGDGTGSGEAYPVLRVYYSAAGAATKSDGAQ